MRTHSDSHIATSPYTLRVMVLLRLIQIRRTYFLPADIFHPSPHNPGLHRKEPSRGRCAHWDNIRPRICRNQLCAGHDWFGAREITTGGRSDIATLRSRLNFQASGIRSNAPWNNTRNFGAYLQPPTQPPRCTGPRLDRLAGHACRSALFTRSGICWGDPSMLSIRLSAGCPRRAAKKKAIIKQQELY